MCHLDGRYMLCTEILRQPLHRDPFVRAPFMQEKTHSSRRPTRRYRPLTTIVSHEAVKPFRSNPKLWLVGDHHDSSGMRRCDQRRRLAVSRCRSCRSRRRWSAATVGPDTDADVRDKRQDQPDCGACMTGDSCPMTAPDDVSDRQTAPGLWQRRVHLAGCSAATSADRRSVRGDGAA